MSPAVAQSLPIISLVVAGFLLKQAGLIRPGDGQVIARLIINTTLPAVIFLSVSRANVTPGRLAVLALCGILVSLGLRVASGWWVNHLKLERQVAGVMVLASMVINVGFFLFPIFQTVYGQEGISRLAAFDLGNSLIASSFGYYLASCYGDKAPCGFQHSLKRVLALPVLWAGLAGLAVNLSGVQLPSFLYKFLEPLGAANTPLAMLTLGSFLQLRYPNWKPMALTVALRMGLGFALGQALVFLAHLQGLERVAVSMGAAMPVGLVVLVYAAMEGLDAEFAAGTISLSILAGLFVTPILLSLY
jgi:malate permease and related proteins